MNGCNGQLDAIRQIAQKPGDAIDFNSDTSDNDSVFYWFDSLFLYSTEYNRKRDLNRKVKAFSFLL